MKPMQNQYRFMKPPPAQIRRAHLDNVALVPGNLLPQIHRWHQLAGELPKDELVIVIPDTDTKQKQTLSTVADLLQKSGYHVRVLTEGELAPPRFGKVTQTELGS
jgi:hypothetical protein